MTRKWTYEHRGDDFILSFAGKAKVSLKSLETGDLRSFVATVIERLNFDGEFAERQAAIEGAEGRIQDEARIQQARLVEQQRDIERQRRYWEPYRKLLEGISLTTVLEMVQRTSSEREKALKKQMREEVLAARLLARGLVK